MWESSRSHATSKRARKACAGYFEGQVRKLRPQDWIAFAQRTWREHRGALTPNHDVRLARALRGLSLERLPTLWDQFDALAHIPLMVIRGANSDMLASSTVNA